MGLVAVKPWFKKHVDVYDRDRRIIAEKYPTLAYEELGNKLFLQGPLRLNHTHSDQVEPIIDEFDIKIDFADDYPDWLPKAYEVGGRKEEIAKKYGISNLRDLHFNTRDNDSACLSAPIIARKYFLPGSAINVFLDELVARFFYGLSYYERHGDFPDGEYRHGDEGIFEAYREEFGIHDLDFLIESVSRLASGMQIKGHSPCPCGSTRRFRNCHSEVFKKVFEAKCRLTRKEALIDLQALQNLKKPAQANI